MERITKTAHGTQRSKLNAFVTAYILNAIDGEGYGKELSTDKEKLEFVADCFINEYCFKDNLIRYGSYQNVFSEWLMGLPSCINIEFRNYQIIQLAKQWGSIPANATGKQEDKIISNWFNFIAAKTFQLMNKHKINIYKTKG
jgi:hypothetical protein